MTITEILKRDSQFKYRLLNRLQQDCYLFLNSGGRLWGITPKYHAETMIAIYNDLKVKPNWLTIRELRNLYFRLTKSEYLK